MIADNLTPYNIRKVPNHNSPQGCRWDTYSSPTPASRGGGQFVRSGSSQEPVLRAAEQHQQGLLELRFLSYVLNIDVF